MPIERLNQITPRIMDDLPTFSCRLEDMPEGFHITDLTYDSENLPYLGPLMPSLLEIAENHYAFHEVVGHTPRQQKMFMQSSLDENVEWLEKVAENSVRVYIDTGRSKTIFQNGDTVKDTTTSNIDNISRSGNSISDESRDYADSSLEMHDDGTVIKKGISETVTTNNDETKSGNNYEITESVKGSDSIIANSTNSNVKDYDSSDTINHGKEKETVSASDNKSVIQSDRESAVRSETETTDGSNSETIFDREPIVDTTETITDNNRKKVITGTDTSLVEPNPDNGNAVNTTTTSGLTKNILYGLNPANSSPQSGVENNNTVTESPKVPVRTTDTKNDSETMTGSSTTTTTHEHVADGYKSTLGQENISKSAHQNETKDNQSGRLESGSTDSITTKETVTAETKTSAVDETNTINESKIQSGANESTTTKKAVVPEVQTSTGESTTVKEYSNGEDTESRTGNKVANNTQAESSTLNRSENENTNQIQSGRMNVSDETHHVYSEYLSRYSNDSSIIQMRDMLKHFPNITGLFVEIFSKDFVCYNAFF